MQYTNCLFINTSRIPRRRSTIGLQCVVSVAVMLTLAPESVAERIDFNNNPIGTGNPQVLSGQGQIVDPPTPTETPLTDGFRITNHSYTVRATGTEAAVFGGWPSSREFELSEQSDLVVRIRGNTDITISGGTAEFFVIGSIDNDSDQTVNFLRQNIGVGTTSVSWNESGIVRNVEAGNHNLRMFSGIRWTPNAVGDTITVTSLYEITVAVPEPSTVALLGIGALGLLGYGWRPQRMRAA